MSKYSEYIANSSEDLEFFEDTHPRGVGMNKQFQGKAPSQPQTAAPLRQARTYNTMVMFEPMSPEDVESLIDYLKNREPAIIKLDKPVHEVSQRILDMLSGAVYALNGSMVRIEGNTFIMMPEGVKVISPN